MEFWRCVRQSECHFAIKYLIFLKNDFNFLHISLTMCKVKYAKYSPVKEILLLKNFMCISLEQEYSFSLAFKTFKMALFRKVAINTIKVMNPKS